MDTPVPTYLHYLPTRILSGPGVLGELGQELERFGPRRAYLVTERFLKNIGFVDRVQKGLAGSPVEVVGVFDRVVPNSLVSLVREGAQEARDLGADMVIAIGGGSSLDTGKAIDLVLSHGGDLLDYQGAQVLTSGLHPLVAIPTTAGTGSEVTNVAVVHDPDTETKLLFVDHHLFPAVAILDPELTLTVPPRITAATGMDALTHAIEAYLSVNAYPISDALALGATRMIIGSLETACRDGSSLAARSAMLNAATLAGLAFAYAGVGVVHALAHTVGGLFGVAHGEANSILLPHGMAFNMEECPERLVELGRILTRAEPARSGDPWAAIHAVVSLKASLKQCAGLPETLGSVAVPPERLGEVAEKALLDGSIIYNRRAATQEDLFRLLERAHAHSGPVRKSSKGD